MSDPRDKQGRGLSTVAAGEQEPGPVVGRVVGHEAGRGLLVDFEGNPAGPLPARTTVALDAAALQQAVASQQEALLLFERGDPARPLLVGLLQPTSETPNLELILQGEGQDAAAAEVTVDGQPRTIEGQQEVVLRCGEASITLRKDGKIVIRGTHVLTRARFTNRIKGGSVQIN